MAILYFDGHCNLCNWIVDFFIRKDTHRRLKFAALQGRTAAERLPKEWRESLPSVVLEHEGQFYTESTAALRATALLGGVFSIARMLLIVPKFVRDPVYRLIATNRYRLFGRRETCRLPTPEERAQFLD